WLRVLGEAQSTLLETSARLRYDAARRLAVAIEANDARWVSGAPGRSGGATGPSRGARAGSPSTRPAARGAGRAGGDSIRLKTRETIRLTSPSREASAKRRFMYASSAALPRGRRPFVPGT